MRKLCFLLTFMLVGSFAFANSNQLTSPFNCITVYTSCGEVGCVLTQEGDTFEDVLEMVDELEEWLCGD